MASLQDAIREELAKLSHPRILDLQTLISAPKRVSATQLYPYASSPRKAQKMCQQDILLLLSESSSGGSSPTTTEVLNGSAPSTDRVFVSAVEAVLYTFSNSRILYIAKVDSTGQGVYPSPTRSLVTGLIQYFASTTLASCPQIPLWVHIFARAQSQYLFPDSSLYAMKHVLSDIKLCRWWKSVVDSIDHPNPNLWHCLPGYLESEATLALSLPTRLKWAYASPYPSPSIPSPPPTQPLSASSSLNLPFPLGSSLDITNVIPSFPDDPKTRFLAEMAVTHEGEGPAPRSRPATPQKKRKRVEPKEDTISTGTSEDAKPKSSSRGEWIGSAQLKSLTANEFWERMAFRQECSMGAITAYYVALYHPTPKGDDPPPPLEASVLPLPTIPLHLHKRICSSLNSNDFSTPTKARRATSILETAIIGLCNGLGSPSTSQSQPDNDIGSLATQQPVADEGSPEDGNFYNKHILTRIVVTNPAIEKKPTPNQNGSDVTVTVLTVRKKKKRPADP